MMRFNTLLLPILVVFFLLPLRSFGQKPTQKASIDPECGTPTPSKEAIQAAEQAILQLKQGMTDKGLSSPVSVPIKAHIIRRTNGTGGFSEATLNTAVTIMNNQFLASNIQFFLCNGVHYIDSDELYDCNLDTESTLLNFNHVHDAINIYFAGTLSSGGSALNGIAFFPSGSVTSNRIVMANSASGNGSTLAHEMGHYFHLYHTHETATAPELVTRGAGANCTTAGDLLCDTPADPCCYNYNSANCTYEGTDLDANGAAYAPLINNLMSYYGQCRSLFTAGQHNRMGDGYLYRTSLMQQSGAYAFACPSVAHAAPTNVTAISGTCSVSITWTDNSTTEKGYIIERSANGSTGFVAVGAVVGANRTSFVDTNPLLGLTAYYRVLAASSNATPSAVASVSVASGLCYCIPATTDCSVGDDIINFSLRASTATLINRASNCSPNGYGDYSATSSATLTPGQNYTITVTNRGQYPEGFTVWIDHNSDRIFTANEIVFASATTVQQAVQSGTFTLSATAVAGQTRLRVRQSDNVGGVPTSACGSFPYGETEDYTITIPGTSTAIASAGSGSWTSAATWTGGQIPTANTEVTIGPNHTVTINGATVQAKKVNLNGKINYQNNGVLRLGQ
jgi:hypothetical protein